MFSASPACNVIGGLTLSLNAVVLYCGGKQCVMTKTSLSHVSMDTTTSSEAGPGPATENPKKL